MKKTEKYLNLAIVTVLALSLTVGCTRVRREKPENYVSDSWITAKVRGALMKNTLINTANIQVLTYRRVVRLGGSVDDQAQADETIKIAKGILGVKSIKNKMVIKSKDNNKNSSKENNNKEHSKK
ncbi:transport-associated protein [Candidatus Nitrosoglobus terrae]|uniref:Transport-associated protein n=1 Tax=Candidatus Nitrosoglobus terrae TaxID=1630141 RepID=A0A1Q2SMI6_9GAMM|nr:BON domain-containing protein [Candidatus Nitrosoglobus terrae]BAW80346.1 transport-associated protein [Candidatus Nitrosoglobus terrae]